MNRYQWEKSLSGCMDTTAAIHLTPTEYIVLTMLAHYADRDGHNARPALARLATDCSTSRRTVQRAMRGLEAKGYVTVDEPGSGRGRPTVYSLVDDMPHLAGNRDTHGDTDSPVKARHHTDAVSGTKQRQHSDTVDTGKGCHAKPERVSPDDLNGDTQVSTDQVRPGNKPGKDDSRAPARAGAREAPSSSSFADGVPIPDEPPAEIETAARRSRAPTPTDSARTLVRFVLGDAGYPRRHLERLAVQVDRLARQHQPEPVIREALIEFDRDPTARPEHLESICGDIVKRERGQRNSTRKPTKAERQFVELEAQKANPNPNVLNHFQSKAIAGGTP